MGSLLKALSSLRTSLAHLFISDTESPPQFLFRGVEIPLRLLNIILQYSEPNRIFAKSCNITMVAHIKQNNNFAAHELLVLQLVSQTYKDVPRFVHIERTGSLVDSEWNKSQVSVGSSSNSSNSDSSSPQSYQTDGNLAKDVLRVPSFQGKTLDDHLSKTCGEGTILLCDVTSTTEEPMSLAQVVVMMNVISKRYPNYNPLTTQCYLYAGLLFDILVEKFDGRVRGSGKRKRAGKSRSPMYFPITLPSGDREANVKRLLEQFEEAWGAFIAIEEKPAKELEVEVGKQGSGLSTMAGPSAGESSLQNGLELNQEELAMIMQLRKTKRDKMRERAEREREH